MGVEHAGQTVVLAVDNIDSELVALAARRLDAQASTVPSGQFRLAAIEDPAGNTIVLSQTLDS